MEAEIAVSNPTPDEETSLFEFTYVHVGCGPNSMRWSYDGINDVCNVICPCGLAISFPQNGTAAKTIAYAAIDGQVHYLPADSFTSSQADAVRVIGKDDALD